MNELTVIKNIIYEVRGRKVMIDRDLAGLYEIETKKLNQAVKRNLKRFPKDFMFQLTDEEQKEAVTKCDHLKSLNIVIKMPVLYRTWSNNACKCT